MVTRVIQEVQKLLPNAIPFNDGDINQAGEYLVFSRFSNISVKEKMFLFRIYIASNTLNKDTKGAINICDSYLKTLQKKRANAIPCYPACLILADEMRLVSNKNDLYIYAINFSVRLRL